jgi:hypothetical protein
VLISLIAMFAALVPPVIVFAVTADLTQPLRNAGYGMDRRFAAVVKAGRYALGVVFWIPAALVFLSVTATFTTYSLYDWGWSVGRLLLATVFAVAGWLLWPAGKMSSTTRIALWIYLSIALLVGAILAAPYFMIYWTCAHDIRNCP